MKNILFATLAIALALALTGCPEPEPTDQPKNQSAEIDGLFDNNATAIVQGNLTDTEWNGVPEKIKAALNAQFGEDGDGPKEVFRLTYTTKNVVIILVKNPSYANYSTTHNGNTMHINFGLLNNTEALKSALRNATRAMAGNSTVSEQD